MNGELKAGQLYYYGVNSDIVEIKKIQDSRVIYIQNKEEYSEPVNVFRSNIEKAGNRLVGDKIKKIKKLNEKIEKTNNKNNKLYLEHKELIQRVVRIIYGKRYEYKSNEEGPKIIHMDSGIEFEFDPLNILSHATKEILPWFNVHNFLYHFAEKKGELELKIYNKSDDLQNIIIKGDTENICLLRGVVEANTLYQQNIIYDTTLINNIAKNIYKNKKIEEKKDYILIVLDRYSEDYIEFNPLKSTEQAMDVVLNEISKVFNYKIEKKETGYTLSICKFDGENVLEERGRDLRKVICLVYESLLGD